jgi:hypothetical protein
VEDLGLQQCVGEESELGDILDWWCSQDLEAARSRCRAAVRAAATLAAPHPHWIWPLLLRQLAMGEGGLNARW